MEKAKADKLTLAKPKWMQQLSPKGNVTSGASAASEATEMSVAQVFCFRGDI